MNKLATILCFALCFAAISIAATAQTTPAPPPVDLPDGPTANPQLLPPAVPTGPTVLIDTTMGRLTCKLFTKEAPLTTANFIGLAQGTKPWIDAATQKKRTGPFYNGLTFHRVIPEFMIQGGDPAGDGTGDPGFFFKDEIDPTLTFDQPGRLAMANAGSGPTGEGTNGSQFFITEVPVPQLNGKHTIFGQCDPNTILLAASIARVDRDANDKPRTPVVMRKVTIVPDGAPIPPPPPAPMPSPAMPPPVPH